MKRVGGMGMPWDGNGGWLGSWLLGAKQRARSERKKRERERKWRGIVKSGRYRGR